MTESVKKNKTAIVSPAGIEGLNIYQRMYKAAGMISVLVKRDVNTFQKYRYVSHDDTVVKVREVFQRCGILATMNVPFWQLEVLKGANNKSSVMAKIDAEMTFINPDDPKDAYTVTIPAYALDQSDKAVGKAISYAKKYALIALCGLMLATGDDVDQDAIEMEQLKNADKNAQDAPESTNMVKGGNDSTDSKKSSQDVNKSDSARTPPIDAVSPKELKAISKKEILALSNHYCISLGCKSATWANDHLSELYEGGWEKAPRPHVENLFLKIQKVLILWDELKNNFIDAHNGDESGAKKELATTAKKMGWLPLYEADPDSISAFIDSKFGEGSKNAK